jgi:hypothetical protein
MSRREGFVAGLDWLAAANRSRFDDMKPLSHPEHGQNDHGGRPERFGDSGQPTLT